MSTKKHSSQWYYDHNKASADKKAGYQKKFNSTKEQIDNRVEHNQMNREAGTYGNGDKKDISKPRVGKKRITKENQSNNRAGEELGGVRSKGASNPNSKGYKAKMKGQRKAKKYGD